MSLPAIELIRLKISDLQAQLLSAHPQMPTLLRDIHKQLRDDPEIVTLLSSEEVGSIVSGLKLQTQTNIATKSATSKKKTPISMMDL